MLNMNHKITWKHLIPGGKPGEGSEVVGLGLFTPLNGPLTKTFHHTQTWMAAAAAAETWTAVCSISRAAASRSLNASSDPGLSHFDKETCVNVIICVDTSSESRERWGRWKARAVLFCERQRLTVLPSDLWINFRLWIKFFFCFSRDFRLL